MKKYSNTLHVIALVIALSCSGCYTFAGTKLQPIEPEKPTYLPPLEYTVGDFAFTLEGGKMVTSNHAGRILNDGIMASWKKRGYISESKYVDGGTFTGTADYNVTLTGSQYGESSVIMQFFTGLTLFLLPSSITQNYDLQYTVEDVKTGKKYQAAVQESDEVIQQLFLLFALPFAGNGHAETLQNMGDHLYDQL